MIKKGKVAVYKLNEITKTLDKSFKYNVKTTEKVANLKWQDLDSIGDFSPFEKSLMRRNNNAFKIRKYNKFI